jgi:hypothetical protein
MLLRSPPSSSPLLRDWSVLRMSRARARFLFWTLPRRAIARIFVSIPAGRSSGNSFLARAVTSGSTSLSIRSVWPRWEQISARTTRARTGVFLSGSLVLGSLWSASNAWMLRSSSAIALSRSGEGVPAGVRASGRLQ